MGNDMENEARTDGSSVFLVGERSSVQSETAPDGNSPAEDLEGYLAVADGIVDEYADVFAGLSNSCWRGQGENHACGQGENLALPR